MEHRKLKQREGGAKAPLFYCFVGAAGVLSGSDNCTKKRPLRALLIAAGPGRIAWYGLHAKFPIVIVRGVAQSRLFLH